MPEIWPKPCALFTPPTLSSLTQSLLNTSQRRFHFRHASLFGFPGFAQKKTFTTRCSHLLIFECHCQGPESLRQGQDRTALESAPWGETATALESAGGQGARRVAKSGESGLVQGCPPVGGSVRAIMQRLLARRAADRAGSASEKASGPFEYLVSWSGYRLHTWESEEIVMTHRPDLVDDFYRVDATCDAVACKEFSERAVGLGDWANRPPPVRSDDKLTTTTISTTAGATCMQNPFTLPATIGGALEKPVRAPAPSLPANPTQSVPASTPPSKLVLSLAPDSRVTLARKPGANVDKASGGQPAQPDSAKPVAAAAGRKRRGTKRAKPTNPSKRGKGGEEKKKPSRKNKREPTPSTKKLRGGARPLLNRRVSKFFRGYGFFKGTVKSRTFETGTGKVLYHVVYDDGDSEDVYETEVRRILLI